MARGLAAGLLATCLLFASHASADDEWRAKQLFFEARDARDAGDHATACAKFSGSLVLFRRASTLLNLGECSEKLGRLADSLRYWREGAALLESSDERYEMAKRRVVELDARVPRLRTKLAGDMPVSTTITLDGVAITRERLGKELRLEAGEHHFELTAEGYAPAKVELTLVEGATKTVTLELGRRIAPPPSSTTAASGPPVVDEQDPQVLWGFIAGGVGGAGIAVGAITGGLVLDRKSTVDEQCDDVTCDTQEGADAADSGRTLSIVSTVGFAVGGAAVATSIVLLATADWGGEDSEVAVVPQVGPGQFGLTLQGRF